MSLTSNEWYRSVGSTWANDGYLRYRYRFLADGTYSFMKEWWSQYHHTDYWFIEESGRYRLDGSTIQLSPSKATKILREKAGSSKAAAEPVPLEAATYRYAFRDLQKLTWSSRPPPASGRHVTVSSPLRETACRTTTSRPRAASSGPHRRTVLEAPSGVGWISSRRDVPM